MRRAFACRQDAPHPKEKLMKHLENRLEDIEEQFDLADEDNDDQISLAEFRSLMLELDRRMHDGAVAASFLAIDTNNDGRIGFAEFRSWWLRD
jgi:Ca2+-binding EF-hand superfamily protein